MSLAGEDLPIVFRDQHYWNFYGRKWLCPRKLCHITGQNFLRIFTTLFSDGNQAARKQGIIYRVNCSLFCLRRLSVIRIAEISVELTGISCVSRIRPIRSTSLVVMRSPPLWWVSRMIRSIFDSSLADSRTVQRSPDACGFDVVTVCDAAT